MILALLLIASVALAPACGTAPAHATAVPDLAPAAPAPPAPPPPVEPAPPEPAPVSPCDPAALAPIVAEAERADARLREISECDAAELQKLSAAVQALHACSGDMKPASRWVFPVADISISLSIGGTNGSGYRASRYLPCYATQYPGHPAHDLFVHDRDHDCRDPSGAPFLARAVEESWVLVAHRGWTPEDPGKGGNYVMLYLPGRHMIAYYAHLETVAVEGGQRLAAGELVGTVGRTGRNAVPRRSPTHLHFGLWDAATFRPINSYKLLMAADDKAPTVRPTATTQAP